MNRQARAAPQFPQADRLRLAAVVTAPACARLFVRSACQRWAPEEQAGTAELLASEMITNSVEATGTLKPDPGYLVIHALATLIEISLLWSGRSLVLEVWDTSPDPPRLLNPDGEAERGRGLQLVDNLSLQWGYNYARGGGKAVWCELALAVEPQAPGRD